MADNNTIAINYSDEKLRILVEEYITQQRGGDFMLRGACDYVLYWAMEDGHTTGVSLFESNQLSQADCDRISDVLVKIAGEGRIAAQGEHFMKLNN